MAIKFLNSVNADSGVLYVDAANDRVGIGTASPETLLQLNGAVYSMIGMYSDHTYSSNRNWRIVTNSFGAGNWGGLAIKTSDTAGGTPNTTRFGIDYLGNVGIGTTSPSQKLHVAGNVIIENSSGAELNLKNTSSGSQWQVVSGYNGGFEIGDVTNSLTDASAVFFITSSTGRVGIGTTAPAYKLDVNGTARVSDLYVSGNIIHDGDTNNRIIFGTDSQTFRTAGTDRLHITSAGNVGIGTTSPTNLLHLNKADSSGAGIDFTNSDATAGLFIGVDSAEVASFWYRENADMKFATNANERVRIAADGKMGIGRSSMTYSLELGKGDSGSNVVMGYYDTSGTRQGFVGVIGTAGAFVDDGVVGDFFVRAQQKLHLSAGTTGNYQATMDTAGNFGIGTASPSERLDVVGNIKAQYNGNNYSRVGQNSSGGYLQAYSGAVEKIMLRSYGDSFINGGNVGIGDTAPDAKLHVQTDGGSTTTPNTVLLVQANTSTTTLAGGGTAILFKGVSSGGNIQNYEQGRIRTFGYATNNAHGFAIDVKPSASNGLTEALSLASNGVLKLPYYGAGYLKTDANGVVSVDSDTIEDTLDSVTDRGNTTSNNITVGNITANGNITTNTGVFYSGNGTKLDLNQYNAGYLRLLTDNTERVRVTATGNVGIGTTNPSEKLHISGDISGINKVLIENTNNGSSSYSVLGFQSDFGHTYHPGLLLNSSTNTAYGGVDSLNLYQYHSKPITLVTNNQVRAIVTGGGNVGIGTTSPRSGYKLTLDKSTNVSGEFVGISIEEAGGTGYGYIRSEDQLTPDTSFVIGHTSRVLTFETGSTERVRIDNSGNVGIGTTSPSYKLDVNGNVGITGDLEFTKVDGIQIKAKESMIFTIDSDDNDSSRVFQVKDGGGDILMTIGDTGTLQLPQYTAGYLKSDASGNITVDSDTIEDTLDSVTTRGNTTTNDITVNNVVANANVTSANNYLIIDSTDNDRAVMLLDGTDNLVLQTGTASGSRGILFKAEGAEQMRIAHTGNVGIGTTSPSEKLHVYHATTNILAYLQSGDADAILAMADNGGSVRIQNTSGNLRFLTGGTASTSGSNTSEVMRITSSNVGIGTASPSEKLHVSGNVRIEGDLTVNGSYTQIDTDVNTTEQWNVTNDGTGPAVTINQTGSQDIMDVQDDGTSVFYIEDGGNVGVGTTDPAAGAIGGVGRALNISSSGNGLIMIDHTDGGAGSDIGSIQFARNTDPLAIIKATHEGATDAAMLTFHTQPTGSDFSGFNLERMRIRSTGSIRFNEYGSNTFTGTAAYALAVDSSGNVIETSYIPSSSSTDFVAVAGDTMSGDLNFEDSNGNTRLTIGNITGSPYEATINTGNYHLVLEAKGTGQGQIRFKTGTSTATEKMRILENGNVGIGTTSPSYKLHVSGNAGITGTLYSNDIEVDNGNQIVINNSSSAGHTIIGGILNTANNGYMRGNVTFSRDDDQITWDNANSVFVHAGGGSTDWSMIAHHSDGMRIYSGAADSVGWSKSYTDFKADHMSIYIDNTGAIQLGQYGAGYLKSDASGNITVDTSTIEDTLDSVTDRGSTTANSVAFGTTTKQTNTDLTVDGTIKAGGKTTYTKGYGSLNTTGNDVAGLVSSFNGASAMFIFTCYGHTGSYQRIVYSCWNTSGTSWNVNKVIDEGDNQFDVTVDAVGATRTFTFVSRSGTASYSPNVNVEHVGAAIDTSYL